MVFLVLTDVTNTESDMNADMEREMELEMIEAALQVEYPPKNGWKLQSDCLLDEVEIDFLLSRNGQNPIAAIIMHCPYLRSADIEMVNRLKDFYAEKMDGRELHVLLIYRELLVRPQRVPKGISLMALYQEHDKQYSVATN